METGEEEGEEEEGASAVFFAEPYWIAANWLQDNTGRVAIAPRPSTDSPPLSLIERGHGYVAATWGDAAFLGVYFHPSLPRWEFERYLQSLTAAIALIGRSKVASLPQWALTWLERDVAWEAAIIQDWFAPPASPDMDVDAASLRLREAMTELCDSSMPRSRRPPPKRAVYWWSAELTGLRVKCVLLCVWEVPKGV